MTVGDEEEIKKTVALYGPVTTIIYADQWDFMHSDGTGVYVDETCSKDREYGDHAVVIVGYGHDEASNQDYWILRNR